MNASKTATKNPICGMTVEEVTALHAVRDGKMFYLRRALAAKVSVHARQR